MGKSRISILKTGLILTACAVLISIYACTEIPSVRSIDGIPADSGKGKPEIKVLIAKQKKFSVSIQGAFKVFGEDEFDQIYHSSKGLESTEFSAKDGIVVADVTNVKVSSMDIIMPVRDSRILINSDSFYVRVRFIADGDELLAVNILPIERYLYGVVTGELGHSEYIEALKAQAVAARSFAVYELKSRASLPFHVRRTTQSQVFASKEKYPIRVIKAVDATKGIVMTFSNKLIKAYYSSTCGGKTAAIDDVWDCLPQVPFASVPCTYCKASKYYTWQYRISKSELRRVLLDEGYRVGAVKEIIIPQDGVGQSGRVRYLRIIVDEKSHNGVIILSGIRFRSLLNKQEENLKSTWFEVHIAKNSIIFSGHGYGHGVGMCQIGAEGQARSGKTFSDILSHYYSGISLIRIY